jgi:hypothetical protein
MCEKIRGGLLESILSGERDIEKRGKNSVADFGRGKRDSDEKL